jgi:hypothetical protein
MPAEDLKALLDTKAQAADWEGYSTVRTGYLATLWETIAEAVDQYIDANKEDAIVASAVEAVDASRPLDVTASRSPSVTDDINRGYTVRSLWVNDAAHIAYVCVDDRPRRASWLPIANGSLTSTGGSAFGYSEPTNDVNGNMIAFETWDGPLKANKTQTQTLTYVGDELTQVAVQDELTGASTTTTLTWDVNGDLLSVATN